MATTGLPSLAKLDKNHDLPFRPKGPMIAALSLSSLMLGTGLSYAATRRPDRADRLELWSGRLLVGGLGLLGASLPLFR